MSKRIEVTQPAGAGARFSPDAFDRQIGKKVPMNIEGRPVEDGCTLVDAKVSEDGSEAVLTLEVPDGALPALGKPGESFGYSPGR